MPGVHLVTVKGTTALNFSKILLLQQKHLLEFIKHASVFLSFYKAIFPKLSMSGLFYLKLATASALPDSNKLKLS